VSAPFKVFGIGLSRTGTTSLTEALKVLGFRARHYPNPAPLLAGDFSVADRFDALTDTPVAAFFRELDARYTGARFILTVRDTESWIASVRDHFLAMGPGLEAGPEGEIRARVYGSTTFDAHRFIQARDAHHGAVRAHFARRPHDLLELDITAGQGWETVCPFLGLPVPRAPFPMLNQRGSHPGKTSDATGGSVGDSWIVGPGIITRPTT